MPIKVNCFYEFALVAVLVVAVMAPGHAAPISVIDDLGQRVTLQQPARRIVALAPHLVENLYAIGAGGRVVGTVEWANYPEAAKAIPRIGNFQSFSTEAVLALKPDVVLLWASGNGQGAMRRLQGLGLKVYASEPRSLDSVAKTLRDLGMLVGRHAQADTIATAFSNRYAGLKTRFAAADPVAVFYQVWHDPLQSINGDHLISAVIELCGGHNVFAEAPALAPKISVESVLARDPELIVSSDDGAGLRQFWAPWTRLRAVRDQRLISIDAALLQRQTPRLLDGAQALCEHIDSVRQARAQP